jgi:hypothetical protein
VEWRRQFAKVIEVALPGKRKLEFPDAALCPRSPQATDGRLRGRSQAHRGVDDDVVDVVVPIQVQGEDVGMLVTGERLVPRVFPG